MNRVKTTSFNFALFTMFVLADKLLNAPNWNTLYCVWHQLNGNCTIGMHCSNAIRTHCTWFKLTTFFTTTVHDLK
jgi:hypothetical protein